MPIIVRLDRVLAQRRVRSRELARAIGLSETNLSLLRSGKVRAVRFSTLSAICDYLACQPGEILEHVANDIEEGSPTEAPEEIALELT